jgi:UPF0271 protein
VTIDLNCDMGEETGVDEEALMPLFTSVNIACGGHAGNEASMRKTVALAARHGVSIGAHPGYPDRKNFGRVALPMRPDELEECVFRQVAALAGLAPLTHVKPHGALYNTAVHDLAVAQSVARGAGRHDAGLILVGLAGTAMLEVWKRLGFRVAAEAFADRRYEPDGTLRSRLHSDALITDPSEAAMQAVRLARGGAETLCIHSDTPGSAGIARAVREALALAGIRLAPLAAWPPPPNPAPNTLS